MPKMLAVKNYKISCLKLCGKTVVVTCLKKCS